MKTITPELLQELLQANQAQLTFWKNNGTNPEETSYYEGKCAVLELLLK